MDENVIPIGEMKVGDGYVVPPDQVLDVAKGKYVKIVAVGETADGEIEILGSHGAPESVLLLSYGQQWLVTNRTVR